MVRMALAKRLVLLRSSHRPSSNGWAMSLTPISFIATFRSSHQCISSIEKIAEYALGAPNGERFEMTKKQVISTDSIEGLYCFLTR